MPILANLKGPIAMSRQLMIPAGDTQLYAVDTPVGTLAVFLLNVNSNVFGSSAFVLGAGIAVVIIAAAIAVLRALVAVAGASW